MKTKIFNLLMAPIVPIFVLVFYFVVNITEYRVISIFLIIVVLIIGYKLYYKMKEKWQHIYSTGIICTDWFLLDILGTISNNDLSFLQPSIAETVVKTII